MRMAVVKELKQQTMKLLKETEKGDIIITAHEIGRASCRERVYVLV